MVVRMNFRFSPLRPLLPRDHLVRPITPFRKLYEPRPYVNSGGVCASLFSLITPLRSLHASRSSTNNGGSSAGGSQSNFFLVPGATMVTIVMLGILHARRLYDDRKVEEMKGKGIEPEFAVDAKASFLWLLPLRSISRLWGVLTSMEIPTLLRPILFKAWARAFHSNLEEASLPLDQYASLQEFFVRALKEGSRPIDLDPNCLVSPVDGVILRFGEIKGPGAVIEQVKGFSYSAFSLLGTGSILHGVVCENVPGEDSEPRPINHSGKGYWWTISFSSPKVRKPTSPRPVVKGLFYCVIYLHPGDYHRVHSPVDWNVLVRRHFSGRLFPLNERALRTINNLHIENERVVLEGRWEEGFMAMAAIGATNIGSIKINCHFITSLHKINGYLTSVEQNKNFWLPHCRHRGKGWLWFSLAKLYIEPELRTNKPRWKLLESDPPVERFYEPGEIGVVLKKGEEVAAFNMGSTVVLVFQAPVAGSQGGSGADEEFKFCVRKGGKVRVGEALGRWSGGSH